MKLISIVIPTYNMERYLNRCLESLIIQDSQLFEKIEIIIVNDGSKDKSLEIAIDYKNKYPNNFIVINKENGNYGSCINSALAIATGLYFRILDADDYFNTNNFLQLINHINSLKEFPDMIITNYLLEYSTGKSRLFQPINIEYNKTYNFDEVDFAEQAKGMMGVMHSNTYKLSILKKINYKQTEGISYTDSEYCFYPLENVKDILFLNYTLYHYQVGRDGQTVSDESYQKNIHHLYIIINRMLSHLEERKLNDAIYTNQLSALRFCLYAYYRTILTNKFMHSENLKELDNRILRLDKELHHSLINFKKYRFIPFVKIWRKYGIECNNIFFYLIYNFITKIKSL